jgi:glycosyltransferase involved in cell wall biosynthesis
VKRICVVLGMHRSGTSAVTRGVVALGAHPGDNLLPANKYNEKGYWEDADIYELNNRILDELYYNWNDVDTTKTNRFESFLSLYKQHFFENAIKILNKRFSYSDTIVIKDPKINILLPFWKEVFNHFTDDVRYMVVTRNPLEVAKSLNNRDSLPMSKGMKLWLYYNYRMLQDLDRDFLTITFSRLLEDLDVELYRISQFLELPIKEESINIFKNDFIQKKLKHYSSDHIVLDNKSISSLYSEMVLWSQHSITVKDEVQNYLSNQRDVINDFLQESSEMFNTIGHFIIDQGEGYRTDLYERRLLDGNEDKISLNFEKYTRVESMRIDPGFNPCVLKLKSIVFKDVEGILGYKVLGGNYIHAYYDLYYFDTSYPQIVIKPDRPDVLNAEIHFEILPFDVSSILFLKNEKYNNLHNDFQEATQELEELYDSNEEKESQLTLISQQLKNKKEQSKEKEEIIDSLKFRLKGKEELIVSLKSSLEEKEEIIDSLKFKLNEEALITESLNSKLIEKEKEILTSNIVKDTNKRVREAEQLLSSIHEKAMKKTYLWHKIAMPLHLIKFILVFIFHPIATSRYLYERWIIKQWGLFDERYYVSENNDLEMSTIDPLKHFINHGWMEERNPSRYFDVQYYLSQNPDVKKSGKNPLYHFIIKGLVERRKPSQVPEYFEIFREQYKIKSKWNVVQYFSKIKEVKTIYKSGHFNKAWYWSMYPDVFLRAQEKRIWKYMDSNNVILKKMARVITHPIWHYILRGVYEGRNPAPFFDTKFYLSENPDVIRTKLNPLYHYCRYGKLEKRRTREAMDGTLGDNQLINAMMQCNDDQLIESHYQITKERLQKEPFVSILVPNYNHAEFLRQRLDSIYNQTHENFEVILMDDCSSDNSREILEEYYNKFPEKTRLVLNKKNSGGVFYQWEKGLSIAKGELIWIAESDDWCTSNFLEELTKSFNDEAVMLAYSQTKFMNGIGNEEIWTIQDFLADIEKDLWGKPFIISAHKLVDQAWSIKNIVPNVSSAVFRNPIKMNLLKDEKWKSMRICGDWAFYIHLIQGGLVAYSTKATNYYRIHNNNTSVGTYKKDVYYKEHEIVSKYIKQLYKVSNDSFDRQAENLKSHWVETRGYFSEEEFVKQYNVEDIKSVEKNRRPHILMAGYSFSAGGGETFPIFLANILKDEGYNVTFLCCDQEKREPGIQNMLRKDIPIVNNVSNLYKIIVDFGIDVIHSHHAWVDNTIMDILPLQLEYFHVVSLHGMYEAIGKKDLKKLLPRLVTRTDKLIYTAEKNLKPFKDTDLYQEDRFVKVGNAFNSEDIKSAHLAEIGIPTDAFVICHVSRAIPEKGWEEAIETVKEARRISGQNIHLLLIGNGPEYNRLKDSATGFIHFLGFRENIQDYYAAADIGYLPSRFKGESFPLVLIACLQSGKPVLASDVGEISMMLEGEDGLAGTIFPLEKGRIPMKKVANIIVKYATDKEYYDERFNQVTSASEKFSTENLLRNYEKVYLEVIENDKSIHGCEVI